MSILTISNHSIRTTRALAAAGARGAVALCFVVCPAVLFYFFVWTDQKPRLDQAPPKSELRNTFKTKHSKAVNLAVYQQQLADIERSFGALLRQLPAAPRCRTCWSTSRRWAWAPASKRNSSSRRRDQEGFLRGAADQDQADGLVSPDG
jgi:hypothetical protein